MELKTKIKVGENEYSEIIVLPETAMTMSRAVHESGGDEKWMPLARAVSRTKIKGLAEEDWNFQTASKLSADDYFIIWAAIGEFDKNFTQEPVLVLR